MKKIKLILLIIVMMITIDLSAGNRRDPNMITLYSGYSWVNGILGGEYQNNNFSLGIGYFPTTGFQGKYKTSISISFGWYIKSYDTNTPYIMFGVATNGHNINSDNISIHTNEPTTIIMGYRYWYKDFSVKGGLGFKYSADYQMVTFELLIGYTF